MFDFWISLRAASPEQDQSTDPLLAKRSAPGGAPPQFYDPESGEIDPAALAAFHAQAGDVEGLVRMLSYQHTAAQAAALDGLRSLGRQGIPYVIELARSPYTAPQVRIHLVGLLDDMAATPDLQGPALRGLALLLTHRERSVYRRALFALIGHGPQSITALLPILASGDPHVRLLASAALVEIGHPAGLNAIGRVAHRMPVRRELAPSLGHRADLTGREPMISGYTADRLLAMMKDPRRSVEERRMAVLRYAQRGGDPAPLRAMLSDEWDQAVRGAAALALGYLDDVFSVAALLEDDSDEAALALTLIHGEVALNTLLIALLHEDPAVRRAAAYGLGLGRSQPSVPHLLPLLEDPDPFVVRAVVVALAHINTTGARQALSTYRQVLVSYRAQKEYHRQDAPSEAHPPHDV